MHDLDDHDAALAGATVAIDLPGDRAGERPTLTDATGTFVLEDVAQPLGSISVYVDAATAAGTLPACVDHRMWIGVHTHAASAAGSALVIRMEDRAVDTAALHRASERREVLAAQWLTFYEGFGNVVEANHADRARLATTLEQFVEQHRNAIDTIKQQRAAMSSHERQQLEDTIESKFASRSAAVRQQAKGAEACQSEPRVRRALRDFPR
ncbi:MAG: carboxypeptidase-like regulatory domain-containing protein [Kofleriaceae bacterium]